MKKLLLSLAMAAIAAMPAMAEIATFDFKANSYGYSVITDNTSKEYLTNATFTEAPINILMNKTAGDGNGFRFWSNTGLRVFKNSTISMSIAGSAATITDVKITTEKDYTISAGDVALTTDDNKVFTWTSSSPVPQVLLTLSVSSNRSISKIEVTYVAGEVDTTLPAMPTISCVDNMVTISSEVEGAEIHYSTVAEPTEADYQLYTAPFEITETVTVSAYVTAGGKNSPVRTFIASYLPLVNDFAALYGLGDVNFKFAGKAAVSYVNGNYIYFVDEAGNGMCTYAYNQPAFVNGNTINLISGVWSNSYKNISNPSYGTISEGPEVLPVASTLADLTGTDADLYRWITLSGCTIANVDSTTAIIRQGEVSVALRNTFLLPADSFTNLSNAKVNAIMLWDKNNSVYYLAPTSITEEPIEVFDFAALYGLGDVNFKFTGKAAVSYVNGNNIYFVDEAGNGMCTYSNSQPTFVNGSTVNLISGTWSNTYKDITNPTYGTISKGPDVLPVPSTLADLTGTDADLYRWIALTDCTISNNADSTITFISQGEVSIVFHNAFKLPAELFIEQTKAKVNAIMLWGKNNSEYYLAPTSITDGTPTAVDAIEVADKAVYFNLQGMPVANPTRGQFVIRKQGNKASKVIF